MVNFENPRARPLDGLTRSVVSPPKIKRLVEQFRAPDLHSEIHKQGFGQQQTLGSGPSTSTSAKSGKPKKSSDLKYDIFGWIILAVGIVAWVGFAKSNMPPPPPR